MHFVQQGRGVLHLLALALPALMVVPAWAQPATAPVQTASSPAPADHPLLPVIRWARAAKQTLEGVQDYSCTFIKRERIHGELREYQYLYTKIRHRPFSVYLHFLGPADLKGREAIYVEGQNGGNLVAHTTGLKHSLVGTVSLRPDSARAMDGNRHPITEIGMLNLTARLLERLEAHLEHHQSEVRYFPGAKVNGRVCTCMQLTALRRLPNDNSHIRRVFVDDELKLPIRFESYDWPTGPNEQPQLAEEYTYLDLKFNHGLTDADFDHRNANYHFD